MSPGFLSPPGSEFDLVEVSGSRIKPSSFGVCVCVFLYVYTKEKKSKSLEK